MSITPTGPALTLVTVTSVLLVFSWILVILRAYVRLRIKGFGLDDWCMCAGIVLFTAFSIAAIISANNGIGTRIEYLDAYYIMQGRKWFTFSQLLYGISIIPIKASICFAMMRITNRRLYRWILYGIIFLNTGAAVAIDITILSICRPVAASWDPSVGGTCADPVIIQNISYFFSAMTILTDWACAILPAFIIWDVQLEFRMKLSIALILGLGIFASSATLIRLPLIISYTADPMNYLYNIANVVTWTAVEGGLAIIAGSLATLRPLLKHVACLNPGSSAGGTTKPSRSGGTTALGTQRGGNNSNNSHALGTMRSGGGGGGHQGGSGKRDGSGGDWQQLSDSDSQKFMLKDSSGCGTVELRSVVVVAADDKDHNHNHHRQAGGGNGIFITRDIMQGSVSSTKGY